MKHFKTFYSKFFCTYSLITHTKWKGKIILFSTMKLVFHRQLLFSTVILSNTVRLHMKFGKAK